MPRLTRAEWSDHLKRWRTSGMTIQDFADQEGLNREKLAWWRWKLDKESTAPARTDAPISAKTEPVPVSFIALHPRATPEEKKVSRCYEVVFASGRLLRIPSDFDEETLWRLLEVLDGGGR